MPKANPQLENGYVKIANDIYDALCRFRMPGEVRQIVDCVVRKTYGFNKKEDWVSNSQLVEMTGMLKGNVSRELSKAITHKIVIKSDNKLRLNKDYHEWVSFKKVIKSDNQKKLSKVITPVIKSDNLELSKVRDTKDNITKDNTNTNVLEEKSSDEKIPITTTSQYGIPILNQGMVILRELNPDVSRLNYNRFSLIRLIKKHGKEVVFERLRFAFSIHSDTYSPKVFNYLDLEQKWDKLDLYMKRQQTSVAQTNFYENGELQISKLMGFKKMQ